MLHCDQVCISSRFRDIRLQSACPVQIVIAHARYHVTCTGVPPMQNLGTYFNFSPKHCLFTMTPIHYSAPMKTKGCLLLRPPMLNAKSSENFLKSPPKLCKFWRFWGSGSHGFQKVVIFTPKGTSLREPTSFEPFCVKIGRGV